MCVSRLLCCLQLHLPYVQTHTLAYGVALSDHFSYKYIDCHLYQGKQAILGSSPPSSHPAWIYSTEPISAPVHPLISHHFTQLSASASLFLLIAHNNPPKSLSGPAFFQLSEQKHNGSSARSTGKQRRSVSLMNAYTSVGDFLCR